MTIAVIHELETVLTIQGILYWDCPYYSRNLKCTAVLTIQGILYLDCPY